jgi:DNA-binding NtrC family response regulator
MAHTILLVDDEDAVRAALRRALKSDGYTILEATSGAEGLDKLKKHDVDIVISDHEMPVMKGTDFLRTARIVRPGTLRILLTGQADVNMAVRAVNEDGVYRFLLKPWNNQDIKVMIRLAVRHLEAERENAQLLELVHASLRRDAAGG